jgi:hypothetical protein
MGLGTGHVPLEATRKTWRNDCEWMKQTLFSNRYCYN